MKRNGGSGVVVVSAGGRPLSRVCVVVLVELINWKIHSKVPFVRFEGKKELASCVCVCVFIFILFYSQFPRFLHRHRCSASAGERFKFFFIFFFCCFCRALGKLSPANGRSSSSSRCLGCVCRKPFNAHNLVVVLGSKKKQTNYEANQHRPPDLLSP